jgi:hypothetical protein
LAPATGIPVYGTNSIRNMSAIASPDRMQPPSDKQVGSAGDENVAFGTELSTRLRVASLSPGQGGAQAVPANGNDLELSPLSPELALIDPELARAARELLPDLPRAIPGASHPAATSVAEPRTMNEDLRGSLEPIPDLGLPRRGVRVASLSSAAGLIVLGAAFTLLVRNEWRLLPREQTQSVEAATSPPRSTPTAPRPATTAATPAATATAPARTATTPARTATAPARTAKAPAPAATSPAPTSTAPAQTTGTTSATTAAPSPRPVAAPGQTFAWVAAPDAAGYEFQLFRGGERIFRKRVDEPRLELAVRWRQSGRTYTLEPGRYRWYVWPISKLTKRQSKVATVQATLVIKRQP